MQTTHERRRREPSYTMPIIFEVLEVSLIWIVFGIFEGTLDISQWGLVSYGLSSVWFLYTFYKLKKVLSRQILYKW